MGGMAYSLDNSYEPLLDGVSVCAEQVTNYLAIFSENGGQLVCLYLI